MNPTVVVPGIRGSGLENYYPTEPTTTWSALQAVFGPSLREALLDVSGRADDSDDVVNRPSRALGLAYDKFIHGLRGRLKAPVYVFPYDWRLSNRTNAQHLADFIDGLRAKPMHSVPDWRSSGQKVNLVCHSMGGLCAREFLGHWLKSRGSTPPVDTLTFIATPHLGSLESVYGMIVGSSPILVFQKELRKLARCLPSVYELLPRFAGVADSSLRPLDIFDAKTWQSNTTQPTDGLEDVTQARLDSASDFLARLPDPLSPEFALQGRVLCICGNRDASTLSRVTVVRDKDVGARRIANWFDFDGATRSAGDEVVLIESAELKGAEIVHVPYDAVDLRVSELFARASFHAGMCVLDETQTIVAAFIRSPNGYRDSLPLNFA